MADQRVSADFIAAFIRQRVSHYAGQPTGAISNHAPLGDYGLDSVAAVSLCADIEDELGFPVEPTIAWDYPTIAAMSRFLADEVAPR